MGEAFKTNRRGEKRVKTIDGKARVKERIWRTKT
jgi:hypothetical protein